jgi:PTH1 family peptidyl-tRNA hydrolase
MNLSGRAVASAMAFYKLELGELLVVVDDIALPAGTLRFRAAGSAGGHNGLKDIESALANLAAVSGKSGQDYHRLRIGIDPPGRIPQKSYVLEPFTAEQKPKMETALQNATSAIALWATQGITSAMNKYNPAEKP